MKKTIVIAIIVCILLCLTACSTLQKVVSEPKVSLHSVELAGINFIGVDLLCKIQIENPNSIDIPFPEIDWQLFLNSNSLIKGTIKNNKRIKAKAATVVEVPVSFEYLQAINAITSLKGKASANFKIALALKFAIPVIGDKVWNIEGDGDVPLPQLPKLTAPTMKVEKMDTSGASIAFSINIENPNPFELPAPKASVDFQINRTSVFKTDAGTGSLVPKSTTPLTLRFAVNHADLVRTVGASLLTARTIETSFSTSFDFGVPAFGKDPTSLNVPWAMPLR